MTATSPSALTSVVLGPVRIARPDAGRPGQELDDTDRCCIDTVEGGVGDFRFCRVREEERGLNDEIELDEAEEAEMMTDVEDEGSGIFELDLEEVEVDKVVDEEGCFLCFFPVG